MPCVKTTGINMAKPQFIVLDKYIYRCVTECRCLLNCKRLELVLLLELHEQ